MLIRSPKELAMMMTSHRKKLKLSQGKVGDLVGLKQQTISEFEIKPDNTQLETLFRIMSALNLDITVSPKDDPLTQTEWKEEW